MYSRFIYIVWQHITQCGFLSSALYHTAKLPNFIEFNNAQLAARWIFPWVNFSKSCHFALSRIPTQKYDSLSCRQATSQSTMTCKKHFPNLPLWYIYNCTLVSSYIVRALFLCLFFFNKAENLSGPPPTWKCITLIAHVCDGHSESHRRMKKRKRCVWSGSIGLFIYTEMVG